MKLLGFLFIFNSLYLKLFAELISRVFDISCYPYCYGNHQYGFIEANSIINIKIKAMEGHEVEFVNEDEIKDLALVEYLGKQSKTILDTSNNKNVYFDIFKFHIKDVASDEELPLLQFNIPDNTYNAETKEYDLVEMSKEIYELFLQNFTALPEINFEISESVASLDVFDNDYILNISNGQSNLEFVNKEEVSKVDGIEYLGQTTKCVQEEEKDCREVTVHRFQMMKNLNDIYCHTGNCLYGVASFDNAESMKNTKLQFSSSDNLLELHFNILPEKFVEVDINQKINAIDVESPSVLYLQLKSGFNFKDENPAIIEQFGSEDLYLYPNCITGVQCSPIVYNTIYKFHIKEVAKDTELPITLTIPYVVLDPYYELNKNRPFSNIGKSGNSGGWGRDMIEKEEKEEEDEDALTLTLTLNIKGKQNQEEEKDEMECTFNGYACCSNPNAKVWYTDANGEWGVEQDEWCIIKKDEKKEKEAEAEAEKESKLKCSSAILKQGYPCCSSTTCKIVYSDNSGDWGVENHAWCGCGTRDPKTVSKTCSKVITRKGYKCCSAKCTVKYTDESGTWGIEDGEWCGC